MLKIKLDTLGLHFFFEGLNFVKRGGDGYTALTLALKVTTNVTLTQNPKILFHLWFGEGERYVVQRQYCSDHETNQTFFSSGRGFMKCTKNWWGRYIVQHPLSPNVALIMKQRKKIWALAQTNFLFMS